MAPTLAEQIESAWSRHRQGDLEYARRAYEQVLREQPDHPVALHYLGLIAQQTGRSRDAVMLLERSIGIDAGNAQVFNHLGQVHLACGAPARAIVSFRQALQIDPDHLDSLNNLANALAAGGDTAAAIALYRRAIELDPRMTRALYNLARTLTKLGGAIDEAVGLYQRVIACDPAFPQAHHNLALCLEELGRFDEAIVHYREALLARPDHVRALANLIALPSFHPEQTLISRARQLLAEPRLDDRDRAKLHHGLGKHHDRAGEFDAAFAHFTQSNRAQGRNMTVFDRGRLSGSIDDLIRAFDPAVFERARSAGHPSTRPVFIVGMPRSGTTLVEQILASHPDVFGAGELTKMPDLIRTLGSSYPRELAGLQADALRTLGAEYLSHIAQLAPPQARRITDKLPFNFMHLGMIALLFPNATLIHCRRHPLDVALSCFIEIFHKIDYMTDLDSIGFCIVQKERLMAHWRRVLPTPIHEIDYERLVTHQADETHRLLAFCGLDWHAGCLEFFRTERRVNTPSRWQVRQSIYRSSAGRWRHYERHLGELAATLREAGLLEPMPAQN